MANYTDDQLIKMEKELKSLYEQTAKELNDKWQKYAEKAEKKTKDLHDKLEHAMLFSTDPKEIEEANNKYIAAMQNATLKNNHYQAMVNQTTDKLAATNEIALAYLNTEMPGVYCHSFNEFAGEKIKGYSFELVNEDAVKNLIVNGNKSLLPQKQLNVPKDKLWNTKQINSQMLQGILQGESIRDISKRLMNVTDMNYKSAVRNARTMATGAENKGHQDSFIRAKNDGVLLKKVWLAGGDGKTRDWHADLNGKAIEVDESWENDYGEIAFPGDPSAHPANVYNCRCAIRAKVVGFKPKEYVSPYISQYQGVAVTNQYYSMLDEDKALGNAFWKALNAEGKPSQVWKAYLAGTTSKAVTKKFDDLLAKYKGTGKAVKPGKAAKAVKAVEPPKPKPDLGMYQDKSMTATYYSCLAEDKALGKEFWATLQAEAKPSQAWKEYLIGVAPKEFTEQLDAILLKHKGEGAWTKPVGAKAAAKKAAKATKGIDPATFSDIGDLNQAYPELYKEVYEVWNSKGWNGLDLKGVWEKYIAGELKDPDFDAIFNSAVKTTTKAAKAEKAVLKAKFKDMNSPWDIDKVDPSAYEAVKGAFLKDLDFTGSFNEYWDAYKAGKIKNKELDTIFKEINFKSALPDTLGECTADQIGSVFDFASIKGVKGIKSTSQYYADWKAGKVIDQDLDNLFNPGAIKTAQATKVIDDAADLQKLEEAKAKLAVAQGNLDSIAGADKVYSGIWKEDVTLADYEAKALSIPAKKEYYHNEIEKLDHQHDAGDISTFTYNHKLKTFEQYLDDLAEFEAKGPVYAQYAKEYQAIAKEVKALTPVSEMFGPEAYTQERKNNAKWFTKKQYHSGDRYYDAALGPAHKQATNAEHRAYMQYTSASGGFNRPLAGFKASSGSGAGGWSPNNFKGIGKVPIDNEGKGQAIKDLTSFIEKSVTPDDIWIQTAQNFATLEGKKGFLGIDYGTLSGMTDKELQQFVGKTSEFGQFISGSINRGGGSYTPGNIRINIYVPQGSEALYVLEDSTFGKAEHEIILQRGGTYRITKMYWGEDAEKGGKKLMVDMELLTGYGYNKFV